VKIQGQNEEMLQAACQQFLGKSEEHIRQIALETLEGHQRAIMGNMTVEVSVVLLHVFEDRAFVLLPLPHRTSTPFKIHRIVVS